MSSSQALTPRIALLLTLPPLMWAGNAVVGRLAVGAVPPVALNAARWAIAFALLWPLGRAVFRSTLRAGTLRLPRLARSFSVTR